MAESGRFQVMASPGFAGWLKAHRVSLALTTYQTGRLMMFGVGEDDKLAFAARSFGRAVGLAGDAQTLWMSTLYQLWRLENVLGEGQARAAYDRLYAPRLSHVTGVLNIHDIGIGADGAPIFVNTQFSCLARPHPAASFQPLWRPRFVSQLRPDDRCHLNGLAMREGRPAFVTACAASDEPEGWRKRRADGGIVIDVDSGEMVVTGLSMPHSPRWHDGKLWLLNSGTGDFGYVEDGALRPVAFCPGWGRGLAFHDGFAVVGLSLAAKGRSFEGLALDLNLARRLTHPRCGIQVIDLASGEAVEWAYFDGAIEEIYDVVPLAGVTRPNAVGFDPKEIEGVINVAPEATFQT